MVKLCASCLVVLVAASCTSEPEPVTRADYVEALATICTETTARFIALPPAPDQISVTDLATSAASLLDNEAARAGRLDIPDDDGLDDDHRAFIRNTTEQADEWRRVAGLAADPAADLLASTDLIRQLVGGRNDLVTEMGIAECRRDGL